jgi:CHASE3 domain sensor protein
MKNKGQSWSQISQSLKINIDSITSRLKTAEESIKYAQSRKREKRNQNVSDTMRDIERSARPLPGS